MDKNKNTNKEKQIGPLVNCKATKLGPTTVQT